MFQLHRRRMKFHYVRRVGRKVTKRHFNTRNIAPVRCSWFCGFLCEKYARFCNLLIGNWLAKKGFVKCQKMPSDSIQNAVLINTNRNLIQ